MSGVPQEWGAAASVSWVHHLGSGSPGALAATPAHLEEETQSDLYDSKVQSPGLVSSFHSDRP